MKPLAALMLACACTFSTTGMSAGANETSLETSTTDPPATATTELVETSRPTSTEAPSTTSDALTDSTATTSSPDPGVAFRISSLDIIDPHFFITDPEDPQVCDADVTLGLNSVVNSNIGNGGFSLVIYFDDLTPGAEMRLFEGDCTDPGDGSPWSCVKNGGIQQTILDTEEVLTQPCRAFDPSMFQPANLPMISDPLPACIRTSPQDFTVAINNLIDPLPFRKAQFVLGPDSNPDPQAIPTALLYGFLTQDAAENIMLEIPLVGLRTMWSIVDVPCMADYPDQLPSVDVVNIDGTNTLGVWMAINLTAERVLYTP